MMDRLWKQTEQEVVCRSLGVSKGAAFNLAVTPLAHARADAIAFSDGYICPALSRPCPDPSRDTQLTVPVPLTANES